MKRRQAKPSWKETPAADAKYRERRAEAQRKANESGFDHYIEANDIFKDYMVGVLPRKENRYGFELRVEVVSPERIESTQIGHGYR